MKKESQKMLTDAEKNIVNENVNFIGKRVCLLLLAILVPLAIGVILIIVKEVKLKGKTDTQVEVTVGVPAENKLGGIKFTVSDGRWEDYSEVTFHVHGFNAGLALDKVICLGKDKKKYSFDWQSYEWKDWLKKYQKVLAEATLGEKNTDLLDPNLIPVK